MLLPIWLPAPFMPHKKYVAEMQNYKNNKNMKNTQKKRKGHPCVPVSQTQVENYILRIRRLAAPEYVRPADKAQNYERLCGSKPPTLTTATNIATTAYAG